ncbi:MAG TPA: hypothetical protein VD838_18100, partial [Anaeromyxobacteraceae bacterium]|nr:hypothetical protein [Anaeromyxobacteraceae bacterium]
LGVGPTAELAWDPDRAMLFASPGIGTAGYAPLRWWRPDGLEADGSLEFTVSDVNTYVPYAIVRGMALSSDRSRLYVTIDQYDSVLAAYSGSISIQGAVLLALDITTNVLGQVSLRPARAVPLGGGLGHVAVVPRPGKRDLLVLPDTTGHKVHVYDDEVGGFVTSFGRDALGRPIFREPFAVASQARGDGGWRVWVASFHDGTLTAIEFDDPNLPGAARIGKRIGNSE